MFYNKMLLYNEIKRCFKTWVVSLICFQVNTETRIYRLKNIMTEECMVVKTFKISKKSRSNAINEFKWMTRIFKETKGRCCIEPLFGEIIKGIVLPFSVSCENKDEYYMVIAMESCESTLTKQIQSRKLTGPGLQVFLLDTMKVLLEVREVFPGFRHNDMHCSNIFVRSNGSICLGDFYYSDQLKDSSCCIDIHTLFDSLATLMLKRRTPRDLKKLFKLMVPVHTNGLSRLDKLSIRKRVLVSDRIDVKGAIKLCSSADFSIF
jgi:tRNA A-37 threonylcarbamoyl transferase component Bud32